MPLEQAEPALDEALTVTPATAAFAKPPRTANTMWPRLARLFALCSLAATLTGCATAEQRFEQGTALENSGQHIEALNRYSQALRKDPGHLESRQRLTALAPEVLNGYLVQSANDARRAAFTNAADAVIAADGLIASMRALGITVAVADDYASIRSERFERAIGQSMDEAQRATIDGNWAQAMDTYQKIARFSPNPQQAQGVQEARIDTLIQAAQAQRSSGHFRQALRHVEQALDIPVATRHEELHHLHELIVYEGTQRVLFLPVLPPPPGTSAPPRWEKSVDDALQREHWRNLPALVDAIGSTSPGPRTYQKIRRLRGSHPRPSRAQVVQAGRAADADWVVLVSLQDYSRAEKITSRKQRAAKLRSGAATNYEVRSGRLTSTATARYELVSVFGNQPDRHALVRATAAEKFNDAFYQGDIRQLALTHQERTLFRSKPSAQAEQVFERQLAHQLATRIAGPILRHLDSH